MDFIIDYDVLRTAYKMYRLGPAEEADLRLVVKTKSFEEYTDRGGMLRSDLAYWFVKKGVKA